MTCNNDRREKIGRIGENISCKTFVKTCQQQNPGCSSPARIRSSFGKHHKKPSFCQLKSFHFYTHYLGYCGGKVLNEAISLITSRNLKSRQTTQEGLGGKLWSGGRSGRLQGKNTDLSKDMERSLSQRAGSAQRWSGWRCFRPESLHDSSLAHLDFQIHLALIVAPSSIFLTGRSLQLNFPQQRQDVSSSYASRSGP